MESIRKCYYASPIILFALLVSCQQREEAQQQVPSPSQQSAETNTEPARQRNIPHSFGKQDGFSWIAYDGVDEPLPTLASDSELVELKRDVVAASQTFATRYQFLSKPGDILVGLKFSNICKEHLIMDIDIAGAYNAGSCFIDKGAQIICLFDDNTRCVLFNDNKFADSYAEVNLCQEDDQDKRTALSTKRIKVMRVYMGTESDKPFDVSFSPNCAELIARSVMILRKTEYPD